MHRQGIIAQIATLGCAASANQVFVVPRHAHAQYTALYRDRLNATVALHEGVLQIGPFASYAVPFLRTSGSIFTRANSARNRLISIGSALTFTLLPAPWSLPGRSALTQLNSVWSSTPNVSATPALP